MRAMQRGVGPLFVREEKEKVAVHYSSSAGRACCKSDLDHLHADKVNCRRRLNSDVYADEYCGDAMIICHARLEQGVGRVKETRWNPTIQSVFGCSVTIIQAAVGAKARPQLVNQVRLIRVEADRSSCWENYCLLY